MLHFFSIVLSLMPARVIHGFSYSLAYILVKIFRFKLKLMRKNLDRAFGDTLTLVQKDRIALTSVVSFLETEVEFLAARNGKLSEKVEIKGRSHLDLALEKGKGAYILCIHMGSWEAMGAAMTHQITPTHVVVKKVGGPRLDAFVCWLRAKNGFNIIARKKKGDALVAMKKILSDNEVVGFVIDQARPGEPKLPFFGHPAKTNTSFAAIWSKQKAPIIPGYCVRKSPGHYEVTLMPEVELVCSEDSKKDIIDHSLRFNQIVESMIRKCPEQYFWLHDRWKE